MTITTSFTAKRRLINNNWNFNIRKKHIFIVVHISIQKEKYQCDATVDEKGTQGSICCKSNGVKSQKIMPFKLASDHELEHLC